VQPFGKTQKGKMATKGCLRHKDPMLDVQSALGRYLVTRFTLAGEVFPDPCSRDFLTMRIWPGRGDSSRSLTYQAHRARFAKLYEAMDIKVTKVTHAPRYFSARKADEEGVPEEVSRVHLLLWSCSVVLQGSKVPKGRCGAFRHGLKLP
jgi:hypothetical protein